MTAATVRVSRTGPATALLAPALLLAVLAATAGLDPAGEVTGLTCAAVMATALTRAGGERLGPASWVTLARAALAVGVAALAADSFRNTTPVALLVALAAVALALDAADGWVARRTRTATALGARFDGEVDAFLILALSVYAAQEYGAWVLAIGLARYAFLAGEWLLPWMRTTLPRRRWRRAVAAAQGVVLTLAAAGVLPRTTTQILLAVALVSLSASMGECAWWLWRRRPPRPSRRGVAVALSALALLIVWAALVAPNRPDHLDLGGFARLPLELLVLVAVAALLPAAPRRVLAVLAGAVLSVLIVVKVLDIGFFTAFDRPFRPVDDSSYAGIGVETLRDATGKSTADLAVVGAALLLLAILAIPVLALLRVTRVAAGHRGWALRAAAVLGVLWVILRVAGAPVASSSAAALAVDEVQSVQADLHDRSVLARQLAHDPFRDTPGNQLLTGLRGKDVLLVFVESYGRSAVQGSSFSPRIDRVLDQGKQQLHAAGFDARSAFLTSPTFGGLSWLAHSTMQSGIKVTGQRRYNQLVDNGRLTLTRAFKRAGWRAAGAMPANHRAWPAGKRFYGYDALYDRRNVGYRGPDFGLPPMPDQYALAAFQRRELAVPGRPPLFAEIDLISSHAPWTRIPRLIPWSRVGDGSVFDRIPPADKGHGVRAAYGRSIEYSLRTLFSFVRRYGDDKTVVVVLGDHQPATVVSGDHADHDVPISVIAHDPKVLRKIGGWGWQNGLLPSSHAPVWPMESFRDRFLTAFR
jgi:phosphatidylglycerophosphate synthase